MNSELRTASGQGTPRRDEQNKPAGIDFLDFLFTVAISIGLTPEIIGQEGLLSEAWHERGAWPSGNDLFDVGVFLLGFFNLTLSWFGYHASIASKPLNYSSAYGMLRFIIDVVLVVLYGVMLIEYRRFEVVFAVLVMVHFIFVVWDGLKVREHWDKYSKREKWINRFRREFVSLFAFLFVGVSGILYWTLHIDRWCVLWTALFITFFYRFNKYYPTWELLCGYRAKSNA